MFVWSYKQTRRRAGGCERLQHVRRPVNIDVEPLGDGVWADLWSAQLEPGDQTWPGKEQPGGGVTSWLYVSQTTIHTDRQESFTLSSLHSKRLLPSEELQVNSAL